LQGRARLGVRGRQVFGQRTAAVGPVRAAAVDVAVAGDLEQPGPEARPRRELAQVGPRFQKRLLRQVFCRVQLRRGPQDTLPNSPEETAAGGFCWRET